MTEHDTDTLEREQHDLDETSEHRTLEERHVPVIEWLESEFPEWEFEVDTSSTGEGEVTRWVARKEGHHQQAELSPGKLQRRLSEYIDRHRARDLNPEDN